MRWRYLVVVSSAAGLQAGGTNDEATVQEALAEDTDEADVVVFDVLYNNMYGNGFQAMGIPAWDEETDTGENDG